MVISVPMADIQSELQNRTAPFCPMSKTGPETYNACFSAITGITLSTSSSGGGSSAGSASTASATIIQSDVARVTRSAVTANNSMMSQGLARFIPAAIF